MFFARVLTIILISAFSTAHAASSSRGFGFNVGLGAPFVTQGGLNYQFSDRFGMALGYNMLNLTFGEAGIKLTMPELLFNFHPFSGSFFIGAGVGQEKLTVSSGSAPGVDEVSVEVEATTTIVKLGWMWGVSNGGFWFGMDVSHISPSGAKETITAPGVPTTSQEYLDAIDSAQKFGNTAYTNITFARLGWLF